MKTRVVAKALILNAENKVLIVRRSDTAPRRPLEWDFVGGIVEPGEEPGVAVTREAAEEAGLQLTRLQISFAKTEIRSERNCVFLYYLAQTGNTDVKLSYEHDQYKWVPIEGAKRVITYHRQLEVLEHVTKSNLIDEFISVIT